MNVTMLDEETEADSLLRTIQDMNARRVRVNDHQLPVLDAALKALSRHIVVNTKDHPTEANAELLRLVRHVEQAYAPVKKELESWKKT